MARVRIELGSEAMILATRKVDGGVELTAALEVAAAEPIAPLPDPVRTTSLAWHGVPAGIASALAEGALAALLQARLRFATLPLGPGGAPLLLIGPPGAGKTLTIARLATRMVMAGCRPLIVTADGKRAGAAEQLAAFTRLLGLTLIAADEPLALARVLARRQDGAPVLIDAPGLNPADPDDQSLLQELRSAACATMAVVLPAGLDPAEAADIAGGFSGAGATYLVATRLDQSRRLGGILAAADCGLALTEAGVGPGAADGLRPLTPEFLAGRLEATPEHAKPPPAAAPPALRLAPRMWPNLQPLSSTPPYSRAEQGSQRRSP